MESEMEDGWIEWSGGEPPVAPETVIDVRFRAFDQPNPFDEYLNDTAKHFAGTSGCGWKHKGSPGDIIAYRIVKA